MQLPPHLEVMPLRRVRINIGLRLAGVLFVAVVLWLTWTQRIDFQVGAAVAFVGLALIFVERYRVLRVWVTKRQLDRNLLDGVQAYRAARPEATTLFEGIAKATQYGAPGYHVIAVGWVVQTSLVSGHCERARALFLPLVAAGWENARRGRLVGTSVCILAAFFYALERNMPEAASWLAKARAKDEKMASHAHVVRLLIAAHAGTAAGVEALQPSLLDAWQQGERGPIDNALLALLAAFAWRQVSRDVESAAWLGRIDSASLGEVLRARKGIAFAPAWPELQAFTREVSMGAGVAAAEQSVR